MMCVSANVLSRLTVILYNICKAKRNLMYSIPDVK